MCKLLKATLVLFLTFSLLQPAIAWGPAGHKIVGSIAFKQLSPQEREKIVAVLKNHPRFQDDFEDEIPDGVDTGRASEVQEWLFQQASIWPDMARSFRGQDKNTFHRPLWHFINLPLFLSEADKTALEGNLTVNLDLDPPAQPELDMNVVQTIRLCRKMLKDHHASARDKGLMLAWLFHTVGDVHQPLHSTALFSRKLFPKGDHGGNLIQTDKNKNLHSLWDGLPGGKLTFNAVRGRAARLLNDPELVKQGERAAKNLDEKAWLDESHAAAVKAAYGPDVLAALKEAETSNEGEELEPVELDEAYLKVSGELASERLVAAGYRLGAVLKEIADQ